MSESWVQILSIFLANAALIIWFRAESRADWRHMDQKTDNMRKESQENYKETQAIIRSIDKEIKDFHNRLIEIELKHKSSQ